MKRFLKYFALLTALAALLAPLAVTAYSYNDPDPVDLSLVFAPETRLDVYVDEAWSGELSDSYGFGDTATITAPTVSGKSFSHWEAEGSVISYDNPLKLTMNAHTTLYAVYANAAPAAKPVAGFTSITRTNDGTRISFQAIASGEAAGIVYSTTATGNNLTIGGIGVTQVAAEKLTDSTTTMPKSILDNNNCWMLQITPDSADAVYHARAYVTVSGTTTYGDVKDVKLSGLESGVSLIANPDSIDPENSLDDALADFAGDIRTITFDANGGVGGTATQAFLPGHTVTLKANTFTRSGYTFNGWSTAAGGGGTAYSDGQSVSLSADTTLYAQWKSPQKPKARVTKAPTANQLTYSGEAQSLVSAGAASGGTMQYALGDNATTAPTSGYTTFIPTASNAGTYYVWYKVVGDENHEDTEPEPVTVIIEDVFVRFASHSLVLSGSIGVNFFLELPELPEFDYSGSYMEFTVNGKTTPVKLDKNARNAKGNYRFTCSVNSVQMADDIQAVFHYKRNGEEKSAEETYSVMTYVKSSRTAGLDQTTKTLIRALECYGHFAQKYLSELRGWTYGVDHKAHEGNYIDYTEAEKAAAGEATASMGISVSRGSKIDKVSFSLLLDTDTAIYLYFKPASTYKGTPTATVNGIAAAVETLADGRFRVSIPNIGAHRLGSEYKVLLTAGSSKTTVKVSAMSYASSVLKNSKDKNQINLAVALYQYCAAAKSYTA